MKGVDEASGDPLCVQGALIVDSELPVLAAVSCTLIPETRATMSIAPAASSVAITTDDTLPAIRDPVLRRIAEMIVSAKASALADHVADRELAAEVLCSNLSISLLVLGLELRAVSMRLPQQRPSRRHTPLLPSNASVDIAAAAPSWAYSVQQLFVASHSHISSAMLLQQLGLQSSMSAHAIRLNTLSLVHSLGHTRLDEHLRAISEFFLVSPQSCFLAEVANTVFEGHEMVGASPSGLLPQRSCVLWTEASLSFAVAHCLQFVSKKSQKFVKYVHFQLSRSSSATTVAQDALDRSAFIQFACQRQRLLTGCHKWFVLLSPTELDRLTVSYTPPFPVSTYFRNDLLKRLTQFSRKILELNALSSALCFVWSRWRHIENDMRSAMLSDVGFSDKKHAVLPTTQFVRDFRVLLHFVQHTVNTLKSYLLERYLSLSTKLSLSLQEQGGRGVDFVATCLAEFFAALQAASVSLTPTEQQALFSSSDSIPTDGHIADEVASDWILLRKGVFLLLDEARHVCAASLSLCIDRNPHLLRDRFWVSERLSTMKAHIENIHALANGLQNERLKQHALSLILYFDLQ
jgi:hypothetical protein